MKLNKLIINNFGPVKEATLYLADKGLVSIEGRNEDGIGADSNGSGKSTIINAILWCNYGEAGKKIKADSVVNDKIKKDCYVTSEWQEEDRNYRITRYRKHKVGKNSVKVEIETDEGWKDITIAGATAVQNQINEILGQDFLTFQASCFAQQDESLDIPAMTDKGLKELLEKVLPFEDLNGQYEIASKQVSDQVKLVKKLEDEVALKNWQIDSNREEGKKAVASFKSYAGDIAAKNAEVDKRIEAKEQAIGVAKYGLTNIDKVEAEIERLKKAIDDIGECNPIAFSISIKRMSEELERKKKEYDEADNHCPVCKQETESKEAIQARLLPAIQRLAEDIQEAKKEEGLVLKKSDERKALAKQMVELFDKEKTHNEAVATIARLKGEIRLLQGQKTVLGSNPHKEAVDRFKTGYDKAVKGKASFEAKLVEAKAELELLEAVQFTYSPKGVRYHMLERIAPRLTTLTNKYLNVLTDGAIEAKWATVIRTAAGDYREKFAITTFVKGIEKEYGALSGGEKRKVRLACFFGLQDLIASRATKNISIWCGDEIDHALDAAGLERLMVLLDAKTKAKSTILVISHNQLREWIPNLAIVTRKDDTSTITGYLNEQG